jgi:DNA primase
VEESVAPASREEVVETVRQRTDIVELISRYVKLKKAGKNYLGLCPFHAEKTPSFTVNPSKNFFHCFGCKESGDVFAFLMKIEGKSFPEALSELAGRAGIQLPQFDPRKAQARESNERLLRLNETAAAFYEQALWQRTPNDGRQYLAHRKLPEECARTFRLGYAPAGWHNLTNYLKKNGQNLDDAVVLGLLAQGSQGPFDVFRDRLIFPIIGLDGKVRGFGARKLSNTDDGPKYLNSRQSPAFDKSEIFYGLHGARSAIHKKGAVVVVEGYFDVLMPVAGGVEHIVATCGTALTVGHVQVLRRLCQQVINVYDADAAGIKGSFRAAELLLAEDLSPYMVTLPEGHDPDSFVRAYGATAFAELIAASRPVLDVLTEQVLAECGSDSVARARGAERLVPLLVACRNDVQLGSYLTMLAERFKISEHELRAAVQNRRRQKALPSTQAPSFSVSTGRHEVVAKDEEICLALLLLFPKLRNRVIGSAALQHFTKGPTRDLLMRILESGTERTAAAWLSDVEDEGLRKRLSARLIDDSITEEVAHQDVAGCLMKIQMRYLRAEQQKFTALVDQAQREGLPEKAKELQNSKKLVNDEIIKLSSVVKGV